MTFSLSDSYDSLDAFLDARAPNQPEFHQAVSEVIDDVKPIIDQLADFKAANVFERLVEPEQIISFRVARIEEAKMQVTTKTRHRCLCGRLRRSHTCAGRHHFGHDDGKDFSLPMSRPPTFNVARSGDLVGREKAALALGLATHVASQSN